MQLNSLQDIAVSRSLNSLRESLELVKRQMVSSLESFPAIQLSEKSHPAKEYLKSLGFPVQGLSDRECCQRYLSLRYQLNSAIASARLNEFDSQLADLDILTMLHDGRIHYKHGKLCFTAKYKTKNKRQLPHP